jgi:hypothetical protein
VGAAALVVGVAVPVAANAAVDLPDLSAEELLDLVASADVDALSGTIEQTSDLGLPDLSSLTGDADALDLATGTHTARIYVDGDRSRIQVLDRLAERNLYVDAAAGEAWWVDSETATATRFSAEDGATTPATPAPVPLTPSEMIDRALAAVDETTDVTVGTDARVAGRPVYELILDPRSADTLVGELRFAVDAETGVPLAVEITARGATEPAFSTGFTDVSFAAPPAETVQFTPGAGVAVTEEVLSPPKRPAADPEVERPAVTGEGWDAVIEMPVGEASADGVDPAVLEQVTREVAGGRVLETALVTVLLTDDGRVLAGAVPAERLVAVAAG